MSYVAKIEIARYHREVVDHIRHTAGKYCNVVDSRTFVNIRCA